MPDIRLKNSKYGTVSLSLDFKTMTINKGQQKDVVVNVKDGVIIGPADVFDKIQKGLLEVVDLYGLELPKEMPAVTTEELKTVTTEQPQTVVAEQPAVADPKPKKKPPVPKPETVVAEQPAIADPKNALQIPQ